MQRDLDSPILRLGPLGRVFRNGVEKFFYVVWSREFREIFPVPIWVRKDPNLESVINHHHQDTVVYENMDPLLGTFFLPLCTFQPAVIFKSK